jgi:hypothetical protein
VARTATKTHPARKSLSDFITERFDDFSRSQKDVARYIVDHLDEAAFQTAEELARRANTSSSTVVRFSQALGFDGYPELQQAAIEEYRHKVAEGQPSGNGGSGAAALFNFDHSEFEASLGADYSNIEETARNLTREQIDHHPPARRERREGRLLDPPHVPPPPRRACSRRGRRPLPRARTDRSRGRTPTLHP